MSTTVKFPSATMRLVGEDGNAYSIMGRATKALKSAGATKEDTDAYLAEAKSGDYGNLLRVTMSWVNCDTDYDDEDDEVCEGCGWDLYECECDD